MNFDEHSREVCLNAEQYVAETTGRVRALNLHKANEF